MASGRILRLTSRNIFTNLAAEERLFEKSSGRALLFYINSDCVVLGRTQNPFNEVDVAYAATHGIPIARRRSGGGTVVHDEGNLNFCFMRPREEHEPLENAKLVASVLHTEFGINAQVNSRADILVDDKKVSGAAYRITRNRAYHHGTLLINSNLERLKRVLKSPLSSTIEAMGTKSVRSPVTNLCEHCDGDLRPGAVIDAIAERFSRTQARVVPVSSALVEREYGGMQAERGELCSHAWVYGQTPKFSFSLQVDDSLILKFDMAKGALVVRVTVQQDKFAENENEMLELERFLNAQVVGLPFDGPAFSRKLEGRSGSDLFEKSRGALKEAVPSQFWRDDIDSADLVYN